MPYDSYMLSTDLSTLNDNGLSSDSEMNYKRLVLGTGPSVTDKPYC